MFWTRYGREALPVIINQESWEVALRDKVKDLGIGWSVQKDRDKVRIKYRPKGQPTQTHTLEAPKYLWEKSKEGDIYTRMADAANALMDEMGWLVSSPNTMAEWSLIYEAMEKARKG